MTATSNTVFLGNGFLSLSEQFAAFRRIMLPSPSGSRNRRSIIDDDDDDDDEDDDDDDDENDDDGDDDDDDDDIFNCNWVDTLWQ